MEFTASTITGAGRGKGLGTPTINLNLDQVPDELHEGIYACIANDQHAVMHYGPRPVFNDTLSCEIHLLDTIPSVDLEEVSVSVLERIRDVRNFPDAEALKEEITKDIRRAREIIENVKW